MTDFINRSAFGKWIFRFLFSYLLLYILPIPWNGIVLIPGLTAELSSVAVELLLSTLSATGWTWVDRSRTDHDLHIYLFTLSLRSFLFITMMVYGFAKVYALQFPFPPLFRLMQTVGELTPMRMMWLFMGYSSTYQIFTGLLEVAGGFLMLFRRTSTLGSLLIAGVMANVALMNFTFDIPVKNLSTHLFLFSLILASFDYQRVLDTFILNKDHKAMYLSTPLHWKWYPKFGSVVQISGVFAVCIFLLGATIYPFTPFKSRAKPELYGVYRIVEDNRPVSAQTWKYLVLDRADIAMIRTDEDQSLMLKYRTDKEHRKLELLEIDGIPVFDQFYKQSGDSLFLSDYRDFSGIYLKLYRIDEQKFRLLE